MKGLHCDERGVEPTAMKILVGVILVAIGLGVGITLYTQFSPEEYLSYIVTATPSSDTIARDSSDTVSISIESLGGHSGTIELTATGVPGGVTASFSPENGTGNFGSTMTVTVTGAAEIKVSTITIKATSGDIEKNADYELTITA